MERDRPSAAGARVINEVKATQTGVLRRRSLAPRAACQSSSRTCRCMSCHPSVQLPLTADTHSSASVSVSDRVCQRWMAGSAYAATSDGTSPTVHGRNVSSSTYKTGWARPPGCLGRPRGAQSSAQNPECHLGLPRPCHRRTLHSGLTSFPPAFRSFLNGRVTSLCGRHLITPPSPSLLAAVACTAPGGERSPEVRGSGVAKSGRWASGLSPCETGPTYSGRCGSSPTHGRRSCSRTSWPPSATT